RRQRVHPQEERTVELERRALLGREPRPRGAQRQPRGPRDVAPVQDALLVDHRAAQDRRGNADRALERRKGRVLAGDLEPPAPRPRSATAGATASKASSSLATASACASHTLAQPFPTASRVSGSWAVASSKRPSAPESASSSSGRSTSTMESPARASPSRSS